MILKNGMDKLNMVMKFKVDGFNYTIFATTETMKFGCGQEGHLVRSCPERAQEPEAESDAGALGGSQAESDGEQTGAAAQEPGMDAQQDRECAALLSQPCQSSDEGEQEEMTFE